MSSYRAAASLDMSECDRYILRVLENQQLTKEAACVVEIRFNPRRQPEDHALELCKGKNTVFYQKLVEALYDKQMAYNVIGAVYRKIRRTATESCEACVNDDFTAARHSEGCGLSDKKAIEKYFGNAILCLGLPFDGCVELRDEMQKKYTATFESIKNEMEAEVARMIAEYGICRSTKLQVCDEGDPLASIKTLIAKEQLHIEKCNAGYSLTAAFDLINFMSKTACYQCKNPTSDTHQCEAPFADKLWKWCIKMKDMLDVDDDVVQTLYDLYY